MVIGVPKEIKTLENRVALTPGGVESLVRRGHTVLVERGAGVGSGISDAEYEAAGAQLVEAAEAWGAELVVKVKEPLPEEYPYLREDLVLFTYLHLAADEALTRALLEAGTAAIAYETVQLANGALPLLTPMSEVAGRMATQVGAHFLEKSQGGRGVLLGGVPGVPPASVVILGGGTVGTNAAKIALGMGAQVTILDVNHARLQYLDDVFGGRIITVTSNEANIKRAVQHADLLIGAVLIPGAKAPKLVTREMLPTMKEGAVIVDVAVDQGGCVETIRPTTHADPTYVVDGVVHYGVANMPGAVPRTSTFALTNQTLPYLLRLAEKGLNALKEDPALLKGLNTLAGRVTHPAVAEAFSLAYTPPDEALAAHA
ncbi:alanine dehydrogenase [Marinithermus hydrothermalis]|uniref:Alanine dehydrogenase n=1 Tax=Marinithermus hydrothermalis (strain DSM 14884 / JCM 11576 / T1) TaxID=869210 RepID=F2NK22_MARHT|nr:alanine dehydrogenase [Marinithermus hydrothermalis]AEB11993.1 alanine dehydrogenase [Marinithermus hydrothermalis DSM 14884]